MSEKSIFKKKSFYIILILILAVVGYAIYVKIMNDRYESKVEGTFVEAAEATETTEDSGRDDTYSLYLDKYKDAIRPENEIAIDLFDYSAGENVEKLDTFEGEEQVLVTKDDGYVEWTVNVPETGLYNIFLKYYPMEGRGIDVERALLINGKIPFSGADNLTFSRIWADGLFHDGVEKKQDNRGNDIRPPQIEAPRWEGVYLKDYEGYFVEPYLFYFEKGENTIRLNAISEPAAISELIIGQQEKLKSYEEYKTSIDTSKFQNSDLEFTLKKQGEDAEFRSSPTLYAIFDRASSNTEPYSAAKIKLNAIGGDAWRVSGQWIEWEFEVPEDGLYNISFKARQNYNRGMVSARRLTIDGEVPFEEASDVEFKYSTGWELTMLSDVNGKPAQIPLTKGKHTIRLEVTLGDLGNILNQIKDSVYRLNGMYRQILVLTGAKPDPYRDYQIDKRYPHVMEAMQKEILILEDIVDQMTEYTGQKGSETAVAGNLAEQLRRFVNNPDVIPRTMENFKQNISSLGTTVLNLSNSQLDIDYLYVSADGAKLPKVEENFFGKAAHEIRSFAASFFEDYSTIGSTYEGEDQEVKIIDVWLLSGRDQSTILKNMIDEIFTPNTGIYVNVKLIDMNTLLPAVVAGTGPDVALTVNNNIPVDYALRNASVDLTQFDDFEEVASEYHPEAFVPYKFQGGIYGIPETLNFNVMFYRKDILENDLGMNIPEDLPQTWDDVIELLPVLQKNNMQFALPSTEREINGMKNPDYSAMLAFLYQNGGQLYADDQTRTMLDNEKSVAAFELYTMFYTHYGIPQKFDFVNRFRTGEMPIGVADYMWFNTLSVFAPEIRGLWDFALVPGTVKEDGTIDRTVATWGQASVMLEGAEDKEACWEFLKWWSAAETKVRFARELESIMGAAARYATANNETFEELAWSHDEANIIREQWKWIKGNPEVAGGYYTFRHMINAFRKVTYDKEDPRETLLDYTRTINDEIRYKRKELGLDE
ncbi:extracellular solute-binding protein [Mobilitalea sibirica]|uniref:Extracellular solute-binding protein n=1 Tax=Mobilitalea sibirica TaxID=1462919 RepID=A0A8J7KZX2_9FIRM|nr:extracellular solute-binding protein [Mobilitalea sibirica]MBH1941133.1 extracellular solute-binding protein [Mobilitalea sibirica]